MGLLVVLHPLLRRAYNALRPVRVSKPATPSSRPDARLEQRISFDLLFSIIFLVVLHGSSAVKVLIILFLNYTLATKLPRPIIPLGTWVGNIALLFANELCHGYPYAKIAEILSPALFGSTNWGVWLDTYRGLIPRWDILFNITVLRMISFNMDYYWSLQQRNGSPIEVLHSPPHCTIPDAH